MVHRIRRLLRYLLSGIRGRSNGYELAPTLNAQLREIVGRHRSPQEYEIYITLGLVRLDEQADIHTFRLTDFGEGLRNRLRSNCLTPLDQAIIKQLKEQQDHTY